MLYKPVVFRIDGGLPPEAKRLMEDFRLAVNCAVRACLRRLMMKAENQAYKLDRVNGVVDLPIKAGCHVTLKLALSDYHRRYLDDPPLSLDSLTLLPDKVIVAFRKGAPKPYDPERGARPEPNGMSHLAGVSLQSTTRL